MIARVVLKMRQSLDGFVRSPSGYDASQPIAIHQMRATMRRLILKISMSVVPVNSQQVDKLRVVVRGRFRFRLVLAAVFAVLGASFRELRSLHYNRPDRTGR
jgi:hypothetical protein